MKVVEKMAAILVLCVTIWRGCMAGCDVDSVAVYRITLNTLWSEEAFPKDYPMHRPKAQWSRVFGQSHNSSYDLYKIGEVASEAVRTFAKTGKIDSLVNQGDEEPKVYDQFAAAAINKGVGLTENMVFVDGKHSYLSLMCRLVPSPDWFVGVDGLNLCVDSSWIDEVSLDLRPLDAGASSGLTFTAPHWETIPPKPVSKHGPRTPLHAAAAFYYPELMELPAIAHLQITKVHEYTTKELNEMARKELMSKLLRKDKRKGAAKIRKIVIEQSDETEEEMTTKNYVDQLKNLEEDPIGTPKPNISDNIVVVITEAPKISTTEAEFGKDLHNMDEVVLAVAKGRRLGLGQHLPRHFRSRLHHAVNRITPDDCIVSEWGEWSACSVTCGFGDKYRYRTIVRQATNRGRECPALNERTHCGNVNSCHKIDYFDW